MRFTESNVTKMYVEEKMTTIDISKMCHCSPTTVAKYLRLWGVNVNPTGRKTIIQRDKLKNK